MREAAAIIERVRRVSTSIQRIDIAVDPAHQTIAPGQHFLARTTESLDPYLREPWTPIRRGVGTLVIERPTGISYHPGQVISLLGPIGTPIALRDMTRTLLLIAFEATPASLLMLAESAIGRGVSVTLALTGAARAYPLEALPPQIEVMHGGEGGDWPEQRGSLKWADQVIAVAPPPHDMARYGRLIEVVRAARVEIAPGYLTGLFQPPMPCGVGACGACLIRCAGRDRLSCIDGPAFDLTTVTLR
jgi:dihydroorotate dehydrogenase electron transfer subunit